MIFFNNACTLNKIFFLTISYLIIFNPVVIAQNKNLTTAQHSIDISSQYPDSTIQITKELIYKSSDSEEQLKGLSFYGLGEGYYYIQEYDSALTAYKNSLNYFITTKDTTMLSSTYNNIGMIHFYKADYGFALDAYLASLNLDKKMHNLLGVAKSHQNIGLIYSNWGMSEQELEHYKIALKIYKQLNDTNSIANLENNLGVTYVQQKNYKKALKHYEKAHGLFKEINDQSGEASALSNIGNVYIYQNDIETAIKCFYSAIKIFRKIDDKRGLTHTYTALGEAYAKKGNKENAIQYFLKSEELNKVLGLKQIQKTNMEFLYQSYKTLGDYKSANRVLEKVIALKDSIFDDEKFTTLAELEKKYNLEKSKKEALIYKAKNEKQRLLLTVTVVFFALIILLLFILMKNNKLKEKQRILVLEQKVLRSQMNPHFIFNTLSAIQCLVIDNKTDEANDYLTEFSKLIRTVLQYSREEKITLKQEKELLQSYFNLQNRRFNNKIKFNIKSEDSISDEKTLIPPMLAQPFIENALEHGQLSDLSDGKITLSFQKKQDKLLFSIEDNGVGINSIPATNNENEHKSIAIDITRERLKLINSGGKGRIVYLKTIDLAEEQKHGTRIEFFIPYEELN